MLSQVARTFPKLQNTPSFSSFTHSLDHLVARISIAQCLASQAQTPRAYLQQIHVYKSQCLNFSNSHH